MATPYTFTVFTPTHNRAATLSRVYESLRAQTFRDFEWLVVDDGSTDGTAELVESWRAEAGFEVRYLWQENAGKHVAFNRGVREAHGELFLPLDSDDACAPESLERLLYWWQAIPAERRDGFSAVTTLCQDQHGRLVGNRFPASPLDCNAFEARIRYGVKGEKWGFQRTDVLRRFPFPEPDEVRYVSEALVWREIGKRYATRYVNEVLRTYWIDEEGKHSLNALAPATLEGHVEQHLQTLNEFWSYFRVNPVEFVRAAVHMVRFSLESGKGPRRIVASVQPPLARLLVVAALPVGALLTLRDRRALRGGNA